MPLVRARRLPLRYNAEVDLPTALAIVALAATAAFIQSLSGFGFALFIVPFLALLIGPKDTVLLSNLMSTLSSGSQSIWLRHSADRRTAGVLLAGAIVGMPMGLAVLLLLDPEALKLVIACMVIFFTLLLMRGFRLHAAGTLGDVAAGLTSGVLNTSTAMSGPPVVLYLQGKGLPPLNFRATIASFFGVSSALGVILLVATGTAEAYVFGAFALSVPAVLGGQALGNRVFHRVDAVVFRRLVYGILLISGATAIAGVVL
jgi:uncharacterized membrane protein YfcA